MPRIVAEVSDDVRRALRTFAGKETERVGRVVTMREVVLGAILDAIGYKERVEKEARLANGAVAAMDKEATAVEEAPAVAETPKPPLRGADW